MSSTAEPSGTGDRGSTERAPFAAVAHRLPAFLPLGVVLLFLGSMLTSTRGHFVPQVVDLYLICQYAQAMAEGHPFHYNAGEPASTGATSLLHTAILGLAHFLGLRKEGLVAFAILGGGLAYLVSVRLARRLATRLSSPREGTLATLLVALGGPVVWGFLYGSDIAIFMLLMLWLLERLVSEWATPPLRTTFVPAALLAVTRPEGWIVAFALGVVATRRVAQRRRPADLILAWVPAALALGVLLLYRLATGAWLGSSFSDKSLLANYSLRDVAAIVSQYGVDVVRGLLLGFYPPQAPVGFAIGWSSLYFPPLGLLLVLLAAVCVPEPRRSAVRWWLGLAALLAVLFAPNVFLGIHFNRYVLWAFPALLALVAVGLGQATALLARQEPAVENRLFMAVGGLFVVLGGLSTIRFAAMYGEMAGEIYRRDVATADWIAQNLPREATLANMATSVEYLTGRRILNLHGVTSPAFFGTRTAEREAGMLESLHRLPPAERPSYLLTTRSNEQGFPILREFVAGSALFVSNSLGDELEIFPMRFDLAGTSSRTYLLESQRAAAGLQEVDRLNVGDGLDESAHGYTFRSRLGDLDLAATARVASYEASESQARVPDSGRVIYGEESFSIRTRPGRDLVVLLRTADSARANVLRASGNFVSEIQFGEASLRLDVDGVPAARLGFNPRPGWDERALRVPGSAVKSAKSRLTFAGHYASFYYWFYQ